MLAGKTVSLSELIVGEPATHIAFAFLAKVRGRVSGELPITFRFSTKGLRAWPVRYQLENLRFLYDVAAVKGSIGSIPVCRFHGLIFDLVIC